MKNIRDRIELSIALAKAEFIERNEGSYLGVFWYLLNPLLLFLLLLLVFYDRVGSEIPGYPSFLLIGIIIFNFFQRATIDCTRVIRMNSYIIKSINFPRSALVHAVTLRTLFSHLFEIILLIAVLLFFNTPLKGLVFYPVILFFFYIFVFGTCLCLSSLAFYITDLENVWTFVSRLIWLGTPIFYAIGDQDRLGFVSVFNPLYYFIKISRDLIIYGRMPSGWMVLGAICWSLLFLLLGLLIFNRLKNKFAELV